MKKFNIEYLWTDYNCEESYDNQVYTSESEEEAISEFVLDYPDRYIVTVRELND